MQDLDHSLFLALNFDGGPLCDRLMLALSGVAMWVPLYALILWLVWRREGWRGTLLFLLLAAAALGVADMVAGIFKHSGLLGDLFPGITPRWRPMFTPALEGLDISPDSLRTLRRMTPEALAAAGYASDWAVHVPAEAVSGRFGTVFDTGYALCPHDLLLAHLPGETLPRRHPLGCRARSPAGLGRRCPAALPHAPQLRE